MGYTPDNEKLNTENLINEIKKFREAAENRLMSNDYNELHKVKLRNIVSTLFSTQLDLNEL